MTQRKRTLVCKPSDKRFTVVRVNGHKDPYDTHAGRSFEQALNTANPDRGSLIEVFAVCAKDAGEARLKPTGTRVWQENVIGPGYQKLRAFRYKTRSRRSTRPPWNGDK